MGLFEGIASTIGGLASSGADLINQTRQNKFNSRMAEYQYSKELENWNMQNAYNSPQAQMARLKAAGLNPNLVYGSSASVGNAVTMPHYQAPTARFTAQPPNIAEVLQTYSDLKIKQEQGRLIGAQADLKEAEAQYSGVLARARAGIASDSRELQTFKRVLGQNEFSRLFQWDSNHGFVVRPEMEEDFMSSIVSKLRKPGFELGKYSAETKNIQNAAALKQIELEFMNKYGKQWWSPLLRLMQIGTSLR